MSHRHRQGDCQGHTGIGKMTVKITQTVGYQSMGGSKFLPSSKKISSIVMRGIVYNVNLWSFCEFKRD